MKLNIHIDGRASNFGAANGCAVDGVGEYQLAIPRTNTHDFTGGWGEAEEIEPACHFYWTRIRQAL
jgi:hypothetical protein